MLTRYITPFLIILAVITYSCGDNSGKYDNNPQSLPSIPEEFRTACKDWLADNGRDPGDYIIDLFLDHQVVLLGEFHRIKHDLLFLKELMPRLYQEDIRVFATEFARRSDQNLVDSLINGQEWDEKLGRHIIFSQFVAWGFREYVDILKTAWKINRDLPDGKKPLRIIALNHIMDFSHFKSEDDWNNPEKWKLVYGGQTEEDWAKPVLAALENGEKILVHCGIRHAFTGYRQPRVEGGEFIEFGVKRMGNYLKDAIGSRAVTVFLHAPWNKQEGYGAGFTYPADGIIDAYMLRSPEGPYPVGFNTADSPFSEVELNNSVYCHGYEKFTISDFCDGWIYMKPLSEYQPVTYIQDWINDSNLEMARQNAMNPGWRNLSVEQLNNACMSYQQDFKRFFAGLK